MLELKQENYFNNNAEIWVVGFVTWYIKYEINGIHQTHSDKKRTLNQWSQWKQEYCLWKHLKVPTWRNNAAALKKRSTTGCCSVTHTSKCCNKTKQRAMRLRTRWRRVSGVWNKGWDGDGETRSPTELQLLPNKRKRCSHWKQKIKTANIIKYVTSLCFSCFSSSPKSRDTWKLISAVNENDRYLRRLATAQFTVTGVKLQNSL